MIILTKKKVTGSNQSLQSLVTSLSPPPPAATGQSRSTFPGPFAMCPWSKAKAASVPEWHQTASRKLGRNGGKKRNQESQFLTVAFFFFGQLSKSIQLPFP